MKTEQVEQLTNWRRLKAGFRALALLPIRSVLVPFGIIPPESLNEIRLGEEDIAAINAIGANPRKSSLRRG